ncbi:MAG: protein kinase, partial [Streptosporangiales bacterium]|nr:protein kinase [Streptosporangiales bacterium]
MTFSEADDGRLLAGRYRLDTPLGRGGMGTVWRATDELLDRGVAVKELRFPPEISAAERSVLKERTKREARAAARLSHPGVVTVLDVVDAEDRPWIVMELVPSRSLAQVVEEDGPLPYRRVAEIGLRLLAALGVAHAAGVIHRDVKPGNVLLGDNGRVVLTDFGLAVLEGDPSLTQSGMIIGSPAYMAPERARGGVVSPASDLWSLGATLYTAVEGRPPYDRKGSMAVLTAALFDDPDPSEHAGPLRPLLEDLLRRDPPARPGIGDAARRLRHILLTPEPRPAADPAQTVALPSSDQTQTLSTTSDQATAPQGPKRLGAVLAGWFGLRRPH